MDWWPGRTATSGSSNRRGTRSRASRRDLPVAMLADHEALAPHRDVDAHAELVRRQPVGARCRQRELVAVAQLENEEAEENAGGHEAERTACARIGHAATQLEAEAAGVGHQRGARRQRIGERV